MAIAPTPKFPENPGTTYDRKMSPAAPGQRGPLRFEEGLATVHHWCYAGIRTSCRSSKS